jgi:hypothetical protein
MAWERISVWRIVGLSAGLFLVGALSAKDKAEPKDPSDKVKEVLGADAIKILKGVTKVEVFRIESGREARKGEKKIGEYPITATGKTQGKAFAGQLVKVLFDDDTYYGQEAKCFEPGLAYRLWKGKATVEVVICFKCTNLRLTARDAKGKVLNESDETPPGGFGGTTSEAALIKLAKKAFPKDKEIQALKAK